MLDAEVAEPLVGVAPVLSHENLEVAGAAVSFAVRGEVPDQGFGRVKVLEPLVDGDSELGGGLKSRQHLSRRRRAGLSAAG